MEKRFPRLDIASIVLHLIQLCEMTLGRMTIEGCKGFPERLCHELARCTQGQIHLVLTARNDVRDAPVLNEEGFKTYVRFGNDTYGWLVLPSAPDQSQEWYPTPGQRQMLASICGCLLWMFEFACSVPLPAQRPDERKDIALTRREREVLRLMCQGKSSQEIARRIGIGTESVERYQLQIRTKLNVEHELQIPLAARMARFFSPLTDLQDETD
jgi:DNA-binding CsgD family transcriptional regulator